MYLKQSLLPILILGGTIPTIVHAGRTDVIADATVIPAPSPDGFSIGTCLNDRYRYFHSEDEFPDLTCDAPKDVGKFWKRISMQAAASCAEGDRLSVEELVFDSLFKEDMRDFAVSSMVILLSAFGVMIRRRYDYSSTWYNSLVLCPLSPMSYLRRCSPTQAHTMNSHHPSSPTSLPSTEIGVPSKP